MIYEESVEGGYVEARVREGKVEGVKVYEGGEVAVEIHPEGGGSIFIKGPDKEVRLSDVRMDFGPIELGFEVGRLARMKYKVGEGKGVVSGDGSLRAGSGKVLYALANGIGNTKGEGEVPDYITHLEEDMIVKSRVLAEVPDVGREDMVEVALYEGDLPVLDGEIKDVLKKGLDALKWVIESQDGERHGELVKDVLREFLDVGMLSGRPVVGMGYSGGFMPLVEGLMVTEGVGLTHLSGIVGLGAAVANLGKGILEILLKVVRYMEGKAEEGIGEALEKLGIVGEGARTFFEAVKAGTWDVAIGIVERAVKVLKVLQPGFSFPNLAAVSDAEFMVNLWGSEDILAKFGIAGYRSELAGFVANPQSPKQLYNIEIVGASHFDYMRRSDADAWNLKVSEFVTDLMLAARSKDELDKFLAKKASEGIARFDNNKWVITLGVL